MEWLRVLLLFFLSCFCFALWCEEVPLPFPLAQEVSSCGGATAGWLVEGRVGAIQRGGRGRFYSHSSTHCEGFLGPQAVAKPISLREQPGVFPAPSVGSASLAFSFYCLGSGVSLTPVVVRPDGTVLRGLPMTALDSPQVLVVSYPAQIGIYDLFVLPQGSSLKDAQARVNVSVSTHPKQGRMMTLRPFDAARCDPDHVSAEFWYRGS